MQDSLLPKRKQTSLKLGSSFLAIKEPTVTVTIGLPPVALAVVRILSRQLIDDQKLPEWVPRGFVTREELSSRLNGWRDGVGDDVPKAVFRTRRRLSTIGEVDGMSGRDWSHQLIEFSPIARAYRLSVSRADQVELV